MDLLHISSAVVWVDFFTMALSKVFSMTRSLDVWYQRFGIVAVLSDCLVIILGILLAQFIAPGASVTTLAAVSVGIQLVHDYLFYLLVILGIPKGHNSMIDLFKTYSGEGGYMILIADALMISGSVFLGDHLTQYDNKTVTFVGLLGVYALTYILYTK
jgi:uncharacterized protein YacL